MDTYKIYNYTPERLFKLLSNKHTSLQSIEEKNHFKYFKEYFSKDGINVRKIIVEEKYISKDYYSDFSSYYAICFKDYSKYTKRLHFFSSNITKSKLKQIILNKEQNEEFENNYLGYIVVKPIPFTTIGITVLANYPVNSVSKPRVFFGTRDYPVNLFGYKLTVNSLAFQEQDGVLSACATTAIWSTLHKACSIDFQIQSKTPNEITKEASLVPSDGGRLFPNKGLSIIQMCKALTSPALVVELRHPQKPEKALKNLYLKQLIFAYSPIGIPIILGIKVPNRNIYSYHAVAVTGYKQKELIPAHPKSEITWLANSIEKIYIHDDQWGPFARVEFMGGNHLITNWTRFHPEKLPGFTIAVIIPVFPKIRLSYDDVEAITIVLNRLLDKAFASIIRFDFSWEIKVNYGINFKSELKKSNLSDTEKEELLYKSLPRYVWISSCSIGKSKIFDFLFDATDLAKSMFASDIVSYNKKAAKYFKKFLKINMDYYTMFRHPNRRKFYEFLINNL